ncbi:MAG: helix-turn-helix transcriptional regulator [Flavobacteriales bacterium]|nr:helix-turn-helix transcriptional regulator [Flavobacteriales bacterium]
MKDEEYLQKLGKRIKEVRQKKKLTQSELAYRMKIDDSSLRRIESGRVNSSINMLRKLAKCLEVSLVELIDIK